MFFLFFFNFFFFNDTATTEIYTSIDTLSLHDALPNCPLPLNSQQRCPSHARAAKADRSEEHTSELQSPIDISYAVFCLKKKKRTWIASVLSCSTQRIKTHQRMS